MSDKVGIAALSYGYLPDGRPGMSNEKLAFLADYYHKRFGWPSYDQHEIASVMKTEPRFVVRKHRQEGHYLDTDEVVDQMAEEMKKDGITTVFVLAHRVIHSQYTAMLFEKHGFEVVTVPFWELSRWWIPFCKGSAQWWTRNIIFMLIYVVRGLLTGKRGEGTPPIKKEGKE